MSTPLTPWMEQLVARITSVPETIIQDELIYVIKDFCKESMAWRALLQGYSVDAGNSDPIDMNPVDGRRECIQVLKVYLDGQELAPASHSRPLPNGEGTPTAFTCEEGSSFVTLLPTPTVASVSGLSAYVALAPKCPDKWMPPHFQRQYFEAILDGTLGRFFIQPNRPFTNEKAGAYHLQRYRNKTREAWAHALRGNTTYATNWVFPEFGV